MNSTGCGTGGRKFTWSHVLVLTLNDNKMTIVFCIKYLVAFSIERNVLRIQQWNFLFNSQANVTIYSFTILPASSSIGFTTLIVLPLLICDLVNTALGRIQIHAFFYKKHSIRNWPLWWQNNQETRVLITQSNLRNCSKSRNFFHCRSWIRWICNTHKNWNTRCYFRYTAFLCISIKI